MGTGIRGPDQPDDGLFHPLELRVARQELACDRLVAASLGLPGEAWLRESGNYDQAWNRLRPSQQADLEARFGEPALQEILSLGGETNLTNLAESLFNLGQRLENADRLAAASAVFSTLASLPPETPIRDRALQRLDAILGRGAPAARSEFLFRRTMSQASDLSSLLAMVIAGGVFQRVRLGLSCGLASQSANLLTRSLGARLLATGGALLTEAPVFAISNVAAHRLFQPESSAQEPLASATWSAFFTLLGLRTMGGLSGLALRRWGAGNSLGQGVLRAVLPQVGMFSGIVLGRQLEVYAGLRPRPSQATLLTDSLATLVQFQVAGRLNQALWSPEFQAQDRSFELLQEKLSFPAPIFLEPNPNLAVVPSGRISQPRPLLGENTPLWGGLLAMMSGGGKNSDRPPPQNSGNDNVVSLDAYRQRRTPSPRRDETQPRLIDQVANASDTEHWIEQLRLGIASWYAHQPLRILERDYRTIESRLRVAPSDVVRLLGFYATRDPAVAKALLLNLCILPAESPFFWEFNRLQWQDGQATAEELREIGNHTLAQFRSAVRQLPGEDSAPPTPQEELEWRQSLGSLSRPILEVLSDPLLSDSQFLYLTYYLQLHRRGYP